MGLLSLRRPFRRRQRRIFLLRLGFFRMPIRKELKLLKKLMLKVFSWFRLCYFFFNLSYSLLKKFTALRHSFAFSFPGSIVRVFLKISAAFIKSFSFK